MDGPLGALTGLPKCLTGSGHPGLCQGPRQRAGGQLREGQAAPTPRCRQPEVGMSS